LGGDLGHLCARRTCVYKLAGSVFMTLCRLVEIAMVVMDRTSVRVSTNQG